MSQRRTAEHEIRSGHAHRENLLIVTELQVPVCMANPVAGDMARMVSRDIATSPGGGCSVGDLRRTRWKLGPKLHETFPPEGGWTGGGQSAAGHWGRPRAMRADRVTVQTGDVGVKTQSRSSSSQIDIPHLTGRVRGGRTGPRCRSGKDARGRGEEDG